MVSLVKNLRSFSFSLSFLLLFIFSSFLLESRWVDYKYYYNAEEVVVVAERSMPKVEKMVIGKEVGREDFIVHYLDVFKYISERTGLSVSQLYGIFIYECAGNSTLWAEHNNGAGIKLSIARHGIVRMADDCGDRLCNFSSYSTQEAFFLDWIRILNLPRYRRAKNKSNLECFKALKTNGWHTDESHRQRASVANSIDRFLNTLP